MCKKVIPGLFLTLFAVSAFASAPAFEEVDSNKDGAISKAEAEAVGIGKKAFAQVDVNQDKQLSPDEYKMILEPKG